MITVCNRVTRIGVGWNYTATRRCTPTDTNHRHLNANCYRPSSYHRCYPGSNKSFPWCALVAVMAVALRRGRGASGRSVTIGIWKRVEAKRREARRESKIVCGISHRIYRGDADIHEQTCISRAYKGMHGGLCTYKYVRESPVLRENRNPVAYSCAVQSSVKNSRFNSPYLPAGNLT